MRTKRYGLDYLSIITARLSVLKQLQLILLTFALLFAVSCNKDSGTGDPNGNVKGPNPNVIFKATLNGASETPPNNSTATGNATLTFNKNTKIFTIFVNFNGITAEAAHIHKGAVGVSGEVVFGFPSPVISPINFTSAVLDSTQQADLNANLYYVNIHSIEFSGGEIRGQLIMQ